MNQDKEKKYIQWIVWAFSIFVVASAVVFWFLTKHELRVEKYHLEQNVMMTKPYRSNIDTITISEDRIIVSGWLIKEHHDIGVVHRQVVFKSKVSNQAVKIATMIVERKDLTTYMNDGVNYSDSGFFATVAVSQLDRKHQDYELYILDQSDNDKQMVKIADSLNEELEKHALGKTETTE